MGDLTIAYRNIRRRAFSSSLTIIGIMVGIAFFLYVVYIILGFGETIAANATNATAAEEVGLEPYHVVQMVVILAVATVGVTSTMFMSITQRTREIGIMKALGFSSGSVLRIFMTESLLLGAVGGIVGCIVGFVLIWFRNFAILPENLQVAGSTIFSSFLWPLVPIGIILAVVLAGLAGFVPSKRGAAMDPEEALYYEW